MFYKNEFPSDVNYLSYLLCSEDLFWYTLVFGSLRPFYFLLSLWLWIFYLQSKEHFVHSRMKMKRRDKNPVIFLISYSWTTLDDYPVHCAPDTNRIINYLFSIYNTDCVGCCLHFCWWIIFLFIIIILLSLPRKVALLWKKKLW